MACKTISVIVTDAVVDAVTLSSAAGLAQRSDAHLDVLCVGIDTTRHDMVPTGAAIMIVESGMEDARAAARKLAVWAEAALPPGFDRITVRTIVVPQLGVESMIARAARYSDLIVVTKPYGAGRGPVQVMVFEAALFETGAPVLVVPSQGLSPRQPRVMVAWDESQQSLNAVRKALPVLQSARMVDVVMVDPPAHSPERSDAGGAICMMLSRHGIKAEVSILSKTLPRVSEVLARFAVEHGCDMVVMGGYGHSRLREAVLGGVTRDLLTATTLPLLMAH